MTPLLTQYIHQHFSRLTKAERGLANYLLTYPDCMMAESGASLAIKAGVSPMTVSRFIRKIGFDDYAAARLAVKQQAFGSSLPEAAGMGERYHRYVSMQTSEHWASRNLELEIDALTRTHSLRNTPTWHHCVSLLVRAEAAYLASYQVARHLAIGLSAQLEMIRPRVSYLEGLDGAYGQLLMDPATYKTLIIIDTYPYSTRAEQLAKETKGAGVEIIIICDEFCHWARQATDNVLAVSTNTGLVFRSKCAVSMLGNLLVNDIIATLGDSARAHMEQFCAMEAKFNQLTR